MIKRKLTFVLFAFAYSANVFADSTVNSDFIKFSEGQKQWWYLGTFTSIAHVVSTQYDENKSDCVWRWYFDNPERRKKQLDESYKLYPKHAPTSVIMALLKRDCGVFK